MSSKKKPRGSLARLAAMLSPTARKEHAARDPWSPSMPSPLRKAVGGGLGPEVVVGGVLPEVPSPQLRTVARGADGSLGFYIQTAAESNTLPVVRLRQGGAAYGILADGDVILSIGGAPVAGYTSADIEARW